MTTSRTARAINGIRDRARLDEIVESALRRSAIWDEVKDDLQKSALALSGGQQQRLCIARALAVDPSVLLMDEPASALDPIATAKIEELIYELKDRYTIVIVTHNMQQAARVSDHTAFFYLGELDRVRRDAGRSSRRRRNGKPKNTSQDDSDRSWNDISSRTLQSSDRTSCRWGRLVNEQLPEPAVRCSRAM